jgi:hypothetical protein
VWRKALRASCARSESGTEPSPSRKDSRRRELDGLSERHALPSDRRLERVEVHDDEIDRADPVFLHRGPIGGLVASREDPPVDLRMQGLDPPPHHLGEAGVVRHLDDLDLRLPQETRRVSRRQQLHVEVTESATELDETGLVRARNQRPPNAGIGRS